MANNAISRCLCDQERIKESREDRGRIEGESRENRGRIEGGLREDRGRIEERKEKREEKGEEKNRCASGEETMMTRDEI